MGVLFRIAWFAGDAGRSDELLGMGSFGKCRTLSTCAGIEDDGEGEGKGKE
jgi:hypothetical protein